MSDLAVSEGLSGQIALYDLDLEAAHRNAAIGHRINQNPAAKSVSFIEPKLSINLRQIPLLFTCQHCVEYLS